jgi:hypothetical protein
MFTIIKIRDAANVGYEDPGWYEHPAGSLSTRATTEELRRDGVDISAVAAATKPATAATLYTCKHHPEVVSDQPGECPKCHMKLVPKAEK